MHKLIENYCGVKVFHNYSDEKLNFYVKVIYPEMLFELNKNPDAPPDSMDVSIEPKNFFFTKVRLLRTVKQASSLIEIRGLVEEHLYESAERFLVLKCPECRQNIKFYEEKGNLRHAKISAFPAYLVYRDLQYRKFKYADCSQCRVAVKAVMRADGSYQIHPI